MTETPVFSASEVMVEHKPLEGKLAKLKAGQLFRTSTRPNLH